MPYKTKQNTKNSTEQICSQPLYKSQTTHHTQPTPKNHQAGCAGNHHHKGSGRSHGVEREPDSVSARKNFSCPTHETRTHTHHPLPGSKHMQAQENNQAQPKQSCRTVPHKNGLPRKEVIQPHLPVRLPCYDFVPIANPTFDHSPRKNG